MYQAREAYADIDPRPALLQQQQPDVVALLQGYAKFIAALCAADELAFEVLVRGRRTGGGTAYAVAGEDGEMEVKFVSTAAVPSRRISPLTLCLAAMPFVPRFLVSEPRPTRRYPFPPLVISC